MRTTYIHSVLALSLATLWSCAQDSSLKNNDSAIKASESSNSWMSARSDAELPEHIPGEVVVTCNGELIKNLSTSKKFLSNALAAPFETQTFKMKQGPSRSLAVISVSQMSVIDTIRTFKEDGLPAGCEVGPNFVMRATALSPVPPTDEFFNLNNFIPGTTTSKNWGVFRIDALKAWQSDVTGEGVIVAVIDTGIGGHTDLNGNMWVNSGEIANNGVDDDNNGFIDDVKGWNFISNNNNPNDDNSHGSHVAGTIAASANNSGGHVGIAPQAKLVGIKVLAANGSGSNASVIGGINYAAMMGFDVANLSLGGGANSQMDAAVRDAVSEGVVMVVAAGNENQNTANVSPARVSEAITVSATTPSDAKAGFSNFGSQVDVGAPGTFIVSCLGNGLNANGIIMDASANRYISIQGTSMAAPHVAGVAALVKSLNPDFTPSEIEQIIRSTAEDLGTPGFDIYFGAGLVDAEAAVNEAMLSANLPPTISLQDSIDAYVGQSLELIVQATDPEGMSVTITAQNLPQGATFNSATKTLKWTPSNADLYESYTVTFSASDGEHSVDKDLMINVKPATQNPGNTTGTSLGPIVSSSAGCSAGSGASFFGVLLMTLIAMTLARTNAKKSTEFDKLE